MGGKMLGIHEEKQALWSPPLLWENDNRDPHGSLGLLSYGGQHAWIIYVSVVFIRI